MNIIDWLHKPYPLLKKPKDKLVLSLSFGIFVYLFLLVFKPFGVNDIIQNRSLFLIGYGFGAFIGLVLNYFVLPYFFSKLFNPEQWQIQKEILYILWSFALVTLFNFSYNTIIGKDISPYRKLWEFFGITVAIGMFPVVILIFLIERNLNKKNTEKAQVLSKFLIDKKVDVANNIQIESESSKGTPFEINLSDFIFAKSDNNYTTIFYLEDGQLQRQLFRLSFKNLEDQLSEFKTVIRCHRSYLVNKEMIKTIKGNARSLVIIVKYFDESLPVSRSFPKERLV